MNLHNLRIATLVSLATAFCLAYSSARAEPPEGKPSTISGSAAVTDGDTIKVDGIKVRLNGYDTPERDSFCGPTDVYEAASIALTDFIDGSEVVCQLTGEKTFDRFVGTCSVHGTDIGSFMVDAGWGRDWKRFSGGKYAAAEKQARKAQRGLWGLSCGEDLWGDRKYD